MFNESSMRHRGFAITQVIPSRYLYLKSFAQLLGVKPAGAFLLCHHSALASLFKERSYPELPITSFELGGKTPVMQLPAFNIPVKVAHR